MYGCESWTVKKAERQRIDAFKLWYWSPQTFNVEFNLTLHKCTHNGEDPTCPVCNKKFSRVASLKAHVMLHEKEEVIISAYTLFTDF